MILDREIFISLEKYFSLTNEIFRGSYEGIKQGCR